MAKIIKFKYEVEIAKEVRLKGYNFLQSSEESELDILDAMEKFGIKEKLKEGHSKLRFGVTYIPQPDGCYIPMYEEPQIEFIGEVKVGTEVEKEKIGFWKRLVTKNMKIKRDKNV